jgi:hypothetical protein
VRDGLDQVFVISNDEKSGASIVTRGDADSPVDDDLLIAVGADGGGAA